jgi:hypothetical protein
MTAKRALGVTLAGIAAILGSVLLLLFVPFLLFAAFGTPLPNAPPFLKAGLLVMSFFLLAFAAWGIATGIGLFRLRLWSRWSILTFSVLLVLSAPRRLCQWR